jgi:hypothetical protein
MTAICMISGVVKQQAHRRRSERPCDARGVRAVQICDGGSDGAARSYAGCAPCTAQKTVAPRRSGARRQAQHGHFDEISTGGGKMKGSETVNSEFQIFQIVKWGRSACRGAQDPPLCALGVLAVGSSGDTGWKPVVLRRERGLSTLIEWPKNVRKRKISKVERGLRGRGAGRGLRLFYFSVGFVGKCGNSSLRVLGDLRGEIFWIDSAPRAGTPGIECGRSTGYDGQARGKRRISVSKIRHGGQKRAGRMQIDAKSGPNRHSDVKQARVGQKLGQPQIIYRTAAAHDWTSDIEWELADVC